MTPHVGIIFLLHDGRLHIDATPTTDAIPYGNLLTHETGHPVEFNTAFTKIGASKRSPFVQFGQLFLCRFSDSLRDSHEVTSLPSPGSFLRARHCLRSRLRSAVTVCLHFHPAQAVRRRIRDANVTAKAYPAILVQTSFDDSQVMYWEPSKYVAKLRALKTDQNPLVFFINMHGGHGGSSGRYDRIREQDRRYAFMLTQLGITR